MTPRFGVSAGVLVPREHADVTSALGAVLVLAGILIVSAPGLLRPGSRLKTDDPSPERVVCPRPPPAPPRPC